MSLEITIVSEPLNADGTPFIMPRKKAFNPDAVLDDTVVNESFNPDEQDDQEEPLVYDGPPSRYVGNAFKEAAKMGYDFS